MSEVPYHAHAPHGWVILHKPVGLSATQAVGRVKRLLGIPKAGHVGTLDPAASGVLPVACGQATKTIPYVRTEPKTYRFVLHIGTQTTTDDTEGEAIAQSSHIPTATKIEAILPRFTGTIQQTPPDFSAIKRAGTRAYHLARQGIKPALTARPVHIHRIQLVAMQAENQALLEVTCGSGTYMRALARDIALALGSVGHAGSICRTECGLFHASDTILLEKLEKIVQGGAPFLDAGSKKGPKSTHVPCWAFGQETGLWNTERVLDDIPVLSVSTAEAAWLKHGRSLTLSAEAIARIDAPEGSLLQAHKDHQLVALGTLHEGHFFPQKVFAS